MAITPGWRCISAMIRSETGDAGEKSENGDHARMALYQRDDPQRESLAGGD